jgi:hypothetical protein
VPRQAASRVKNPGVIPDVQWHIEGAALRADPIRAPAALISPVQARACLRDTLEWKKVPVSDYGKKTC